MAKDLPFFKFNASEWISGDITLEDLTTQGAFINICSYFWFKSGSITLTEIKRRLKLKQATIDVLVNNNHIKLNDDYIEISFLREQLNERGLISKRNSKNGSKGGAPKGNKNAEKNNPKQPKTSNKERERERERERDSIVVLPFESEEFKKAWSDWISHRIQLKKRLTQKTIEMQLRTLAAVSEQTAINMINQSIGNGWTGLFELKQNNNNGKIIKPSASKLAQLIAERGYTDGAAQ